MVSVTDAPPEKLYRPDISLTAWRNLAETEYADKIAAAVAHQPAKPERSVRARRATGRNTAAVKTGPVETNGASQPDAPAAAETE